MNQKLFQTACFLAATGIILGAFAAHGLKDKIPVEKLAVFETGVKYHLFHALALMLLSFNGTHFIARRLKISVILILTGIFLFSGSLYALSTIDINGLLPVKSVLGPVTPLGGMCFIVGWLVLAFSFSKK